MTVFGRMGRTVHPAAAHGRSAAERVDGQRTATLSTAQGEASNLPN